MAGAVAAAAGAFGFDAFLAMAPEVETARIAKPTIMTFFMLAPLVEKTPLSRRPHNSCRKEVFPEPGKLGRVAPCVRARMATKSDLRYRTDIIGPRNR